MLLFKKDIKRANIYKYHKYENGSYMFELNELCEGWKYWFSEMAEYVDLVIFGGWLVL